MALLLSLPARTPSANRTARAATGPAEIVILPCIRRERIDIEPADFATRAVELPTQRQA
ncbi:MULTISPECIES: hypothetical protein [unclassified Aureimonas]|uniref:hypothetical protein n=1 Tax=unclassified Aureimonas TaxID=2615206 RepID=UPI000B268B52|nr:MULTISPECIES: hypothetical protein [unclassified Aureimonas]